MRVDEDIRNGDKNEDGRYQFVGIIGSFVVDSGIVHLFKNKSAFGVGAFDKVIVPIHHLLKGTLLVLLKFLFG